MRRIIFFFGALVGGLAIVAMVFGAIRRRAVAGRSVRCGARRISQSHAPFPLKHFTKTSCPARLTL